MWRFGGERLVGVALQVQAERRLVLDQAIIALPAVHQTGNEYAVSHSERTSRQITLNPLTQRLYDPDRLMSEHDGIRQPVMKRGL